MDIESDQSNGWEEVAAQLIERRDHSSIGVGVVRSWAKGLRLGASILDLGCGSGVPVSQALMDEGFVVTGIDASPTLVAVFRSRFPSADVACEPAETSRFFRRTYDAVTAIGLMFLLSESAQQTVIANVSSALKGGGRFLFDAPSQKCTWSDLMTGRQSRSLGVAAYRAIFSECGLALGNEYSDDAQNHYYDAIRR